MAILCPNCAGKGRFQPPPYPCSKCNGRGYTTRIEWTGAEQLTRSYEVTTPCAACNRTGKIAVPPVACDWCDSTGEVKVVVIPVPCPQCSGVGVVPGPEKHLSGLSNHQIVCPGCKGSKTVLQSRYVPDRD
jgi:DnaJ-class molecular chaperone